MKNPEEKFNFKPNFHVEIIDSEKLVLFSEDKHHLLKGHIYVGIAKMLHFGPSSENALIQNLSITFQIEYIQKAINRLKNKGFLTKHCENSQKNILAFWSDLDFEAHNLQMGSATVKNFSNQDCSALVKYLGDLSVEVKEDGDFLIAVVDNYINEELFDFNAERLKDGKPWILVKPYGRTIWIGPIFGPGKSGCWSCLEKKLKENRRVEVDLFGLDNKKLNIPALPSLPTTQGIAMQLVATEVAKWQRSKHSHPLLSNLITFDLGKLELRLHHFSPIKFCNACQPLREESLPQSPILKSSPKKCLFNEGERACSLEESYENIKNVVSPITGIVPFIQHRIVNDEHICYTLRTLPLPSKDEFNLHKPYFRTPESATGKGKTKLQATVGCIAEAIERYNCTFSYQAEIRCRYEEIEKDAYHPFELLNFSETQYENREKINSQRPGFNQIARRYDDSEIGWTPVYSMTQDRFCYVPSSYCYLHYPVLKDVEMCPGSSNGCASGNTLEEAIFYAILELVERDAVAIWWYNRIKRPCVDFNRLNNPHFNQIHAKFKEKNREFCVLDITTDLQIPCYVAVSWKSDGSQIFFGSGSHLQPCIGIARAISELNQIMIRADMPKDVDLESIVATERDLVKWSITENIENHIYLTPSESCIPLNLFPVSNDFLLDINNCLKIFKNRGLDVLFYDLSTPDIPFHTVRLIIPSLRHFWSRLGPGRLYEVPVNLGWIQQPLDEILTNPIPYFL